MSDTRTRPPRPPGLSVPNWPQRLAQQCRPGTQHYRLAYELCSNPSEVPLPRITDSRPSGLGIKQHGARITELRERGFGIENRMKNVNGETHSWYRLTATPWDEEVLGPKPPLFANVEGGINA